jgi:methylase of polypeptide subunit release factors
VPVERKPLFRPDVLRPRLKSFEVPAATLAQRGVLERWAALLGSPEADQRKEQELLADFLNDVCVRLLGYTRPADDPARSTISREQHVQAHGKFADAVLGEFTPDSRRYVVALEGKGPTDPLDVPHKNRKVSAVEQAYGYAINLPCDWIIVTSMRETRLYCKGADQATYEAFRIADLATNDHLFKKFVYLLAAERVVPEKGRCHLDLLREASDKAGRDLTKEFYQWYAAMREDVYEQLCAHNPQLDRHTVLSATQHLLDRVLFCAFCEDRGLLPESTLKDAFTHRDKYNPRPVWENFKSLFRFIDEGHERDPKIPRYNGGLFAVDPVVDSLVVPDGLCKHFFDLGDYEYRQAAEVADEPESEEDADQRPLVDVDILGHIFEQSISDLEQIRNELDGLVEPQGKEKHKTRRKKEGAFYTPAFITRYIVEQTLGKTLAERFEGVRARLAGEAKGAAAKALEDPRAYDVEELKKGPREALIRFWEAWQDELATIRVLDPACGSGAFLIEAFDHLHAEYRQTNDRLTELQGKQMGLFYPDARILQSNLYGVDLNEEAIQICRLSLWIKTARRDQVLTSLDHTIRVGNSVVDDPAVHPLAFDWETAFPEVTTAGGFDVVVGNPPYVRQEWLSDYKPYLQSAYKAYHGMADLYVYFYERGLRVLKPAGLLSFIVTNKWMKAGYGEPLRRLFAADAWIESVVDFGHAKQIFPDADVFPSIIVARKPSEATKPKLA